MEWCAEVYRAVDLGYTCIFETFRHHTQLEATLLIYMVRENAENAIIQAGEVWLGSISCRWWI